MRLSLFSLTAMMVLPALVSGQQQSGAAQVGTEQVAADPVLPTAETASWEAASWADIPLDTFAEENPSQENTSPSEAQAGATPESSENIGAETAGIGAETAGFRKKPIIRHGPGINIGPGINVGPGINIGPGIHLGPNLGPNFGPRHFVQEKIPLPGPFNAFQCGLLKLSCREIAIVTDRLFDVYNRDAQPAAFRLRHLPIGFGPLRTRNQAITAVEVNYPTDFGAQLYFRPLWGRSAKFYVVGFSLYDLFTNLFDGEGKPITRLRLYNRLIKQENEFNAQFCPRVLPQTSCGALPAAADGLLERKHGLADNVFGHFIGHVGGAGALGVGGGFGVGKGFGVAGGFGVGAGGVKF